MSGERMEKAKLFQEELDFAFFAVRLGWSYADYQDTTYSQRRLIRKELESYSVQESSLFKNAVEVAVGNVMRKRGQQKAKLWKKKRRDGERVVSAEEASAVKRAMAHRAPWTPWQGRGGQNG